MANTGLFDNAYSLPFVLWLGEIKTLSQVMYSVDRFMATRANAILDRDGQFWEDGFYEHAIRDREDFDTILLYIHENPVSAGLVRLCEEWPFSTANPKYEADIDWEWLGHSIPKPIGGGNKFRASDLPMRYR